MSTTTTRAKKTKKTVLKFAFLVHREESERWGVTWIARSVLTGGIAEGRTKKNAIVNLARGIDAAIYVAAKFGQSPLEWYEARELDEPKQLAAFCRHVSNGVETEVIEMKNGDCMIEASIAVGQAE